MTNAERIASLIFKRATNSLTPGEEQELQQWADRSGENRRLLKRWQDEVEREELLAGYRRFCEATGEAQAGNGAADAARGMNRRQKVRAVVGIAAAVMIWLLVKWLSPAAKKQQQPVASALVWKQLVVKKGAQRDTVLSDGTRIWVNTGSELLYPVEFTAQQRLVILNGEAYFEVVKDAARPFIVRVKNRKDSTDIRVLGTHLNVKAYRNEPLNTTVLQGKVSISSSHKPAELLMAGQQLIIDSGGAVQRFNEVDMEQVMAWKDNFFDFNKTSVHDMLEEFARWYDVTVVEKDTIKEEYSGQFSRDMTLRAILIVLEESEKLKFDLQDKILIVKKPGKN